MLEGIERKEMVKTEVGIQEYSLLVMQAPSDRIRD